MMTQLNNTSVAHMDAILASQKAFLKSGTTLNVEFRKQQLKNLLAAIEESEKDISDALWADLHKSYEEAYLTEISIVKGEIRQAIRHVGKWAHRERLHTPLTLFGSRSYVVKEPLGVSLIVSPWNYPFQLLLNPLVGAIAAGCTAVLKPSPYVPAVSTAIEKMIARAFPEDYVAVVQGNRDVNRYLFSMKFDMIFFTGSPALARKLAAAAAENLVPMVLELGGKSPCIIDKDADVKLAAMRVAWGKTLNAGQTCIAPDYIIIHRSVKDKFVEEFGKCVTKLHGADIKDSKYYVRMVSDKAFERVSGYMEEGDVLYGGRFDASARFIEPTLLDNIPSGAAALSEEIFGPVFPVVTMDDAGSSFADKVVEYVTEREKPLAFYYFGDESTGWDLIGRTSSGGACINDTIMHIANPNLPFGGVGNSGMGRYHGVDSFEVFTHRRSVVSSPVLFDIPFRYMPYRFFSVIKKIL